MKKSTCVFVLGIALLAGVANSETPSATREEAREIFARTIGFQTSIGLNQVPAMAAYLAEKFRAAGFPEGDIHLIPQGETAALVVRYRGDGSGVRPVLNLISFSKTPFQR